MKQVFLFSVLSCLLWSSASRAEELAANAKYVGPKTITVSSVGISFEVPKGWLGALSGDNFMVGAEGVEGFIALSSKRANRREILADFSRSHDLGNGYTLRPVARPSTRGNVIEADVVVTNGWDSRPGQVRAVIGKHGFVALLNAVGTERALPRVLRAANSIERSLSFKEVKQNASLARRLTGCWTHVESSGGGSGSSFSEQKLYLRANGSYSSSGFTTVSAGGMGSTRESRDQGSYEVRGNLLLRHSQDGQSYSTTIQFDGGVLYLGSTKYLPCD